MNNKADIAGEALRRVLDGAASAYDAAATAAEQARRLTGARWATIFLDDIVASAGEQPAWSRRPEAATYLQQIAAAGAAVQWPQELPSPLNRIPAAERPATGLIVPFAGDGTGALGVFDFPPGAATADVVHALESIAGTLGLILRNAALEREMVHLRERTERLIHERQQEERQRRIAMLALDTTSESVHWIDGAGRIIYANPAALRELGYSAEEFRQMRVSDIDPNLTQEQWESRRDTQEERRDGVRKFKTLHRRKDGSVIPVEIDADGFEYEGARYYIAIGRDISERVAAEQALRESEAKFSAMFNLSPDPLVLTRLSDGVMLEVNRSFCEVFGYQADEAIGCSSLPGGINLWTDAALRQLWQTQLIRDGEVLGYETPLRRRDGAVITVLMSSKIIEMGGEQCAIVVAHDITQRKLAEEALRREKVEQEALIKKLAEAQSQLLQSEKLASIGQLAAGVAHEINNPIGYVSSNLGTLKEYAEELLALVAAYEAADEVLQQQPQLFAPIAELKRKSDIAFLRDDLRNLISESIDGANRVRRIVQDLRDFSRVGASDWQRYDIHAGLDSTINVVWNEIKYKAELIRDYGELPQVECIPSQLNQVFMNILVNAAQAMEERGTITIHTEPVGDEVQIAITDTGQGIAPDNLAKLFDPFFTTKPVGQGTGLGLSVSYGIIKHHGGHIDVQSEPGKGTTFTVRLPVDHPHAADEELPATD